MCIRDSPLKLVAMAAPLRYEFRDNAAALINEWVEAGLVIRYSVSTRQAVLFFKGFRRHQQGMEYSREPASRFPPPPGWSRTQEGLVPDDPELCFRLAEAFHPKSSYRRTLIDAAGADVPESIDGTSRSVRDGSGFSSGTSAPAAVRSVFRYSLRGWNDSARRKHNSGSSGTSPSWVRLQPGGGGKRLAGSRLYSMPC